MAQGRVESEPAVPQRLGNVVCKLINCAPHLTACGAQFSRTQSAIMRWHSERMTIKKFQGRCGYAFAIT